MAPLKDLDVRSRAAAALVEDWHRAHRLVRAVWKLEDMVDLLLAAIEVAREVQSALAAETGDLPAVNGAGWQAAKAAISYFLDSLARLKTASDGLLEVVEMFENEGYVVAKGEHVRESERVLSMLIHDGETLLEDLEWQKLETELIPNERLRAIQEYLRSTGQASA